MMQTTRRTEKSTMLRKRILSITLALALIVPVPSAYGNYNSTDTGNLDLKSGESITIVPHASTAHQQAVAVGLSITVASQATAIGNNVNASGYGAVAVGGDDLKEIHYTGYVYDSSFGDSANKDKGYRYLTSNATGTVALGSSAWAGGTKLDSNGASSADDAGKFAVAVGARASAYGNSSLALGSHSTATAQDALAMMSLSKADGVKSIAIGVGAQVDNLAPDSIAIGSDAKSLYSSRSVVLGIDSVAERSPSVVLIGDRAKTKNASESFVGGTQASAINSSSAVAIGPSSSVSNGSSNSVAIGSSAKITDSGNSVAIGSAATAAAGTHGSVALGYSATNNAGDAGVAIGSYATIEATNGTALGALTGVSTSDGVALGSSSMADRGAFATEVEAPFSKAKLNATNTLGAVSVGGQGKLRQIINVGDGTEDTDAVNVRQLKSAEVHYFSVGSSETEAGSNYDNKGANKEAVAIGAYARAVEKSVALGTKTLAKGLETVVVGYDSLADDKGVSIGSNVKNTGGIAIGFDSKIGAWQGSTADSYITGGIAIGRSAQAISVGSVALGDGAKALIEFGTALGDDSQTTVNSGVALGNEAIANRAAWIDESKIAPFSNQDLKGITMGAVSVGRPAEGNPGDADYKAEQLRQIINVGDGTEDTDAVNIRQLKAVDDKLTETTAKADLAVLYDTDSLGNKMNTVTLIGGNTSQSVTIKNLAPGALSATSTDAVNGSQLFDTNQKVGSNTRKITNITNSAGIKYFKVDAAAVPVGRQDNALATGGASTAVGQSSRAYAHQSTAVGYASEANQYASALGSQVNASGSNSVVVGSYGTASGVGAIAIGSGNSETRVSASGNHSVAIGFKTQTDVDSVSSVAMGLSAKVSASPSALALGASSTVENSRFALALGAVAKVTNAAHSAVALGARSKATAADGVALGSSSVADRAAFATETEAPFSKAKLNAANTLGAVSVGGNDKLRQITNVGDGTEDTDAVNLRQLKAVGTNIAELDKLSVKYDSDAKDTVTLGGAGSTTLVQLTNVKAGDLSANSTDAVNGSQLFTTNQNVTKNTTDISNLDGRVTTNTQNITSNTTNIANLKSGFDVKVGNESHQVKLGDDSKPAVEFASGNAGQGLDVKLEGNKVTYSIDKAKLVTNITGDIVKVINEGNNPVTNIEAKFKLLAGTGTAQEVTLRKGVTPEISFKGEEGKIVTEVGGAADKPEITIKAHADLGKNINISENETITNLDGRVSNNTTKITNLDNRVTENRTDIDNLQTTVNNLGDSDKLSVKYDSEEKDTVTLGGKDATKSVKLKNVAAGEADTDAVNVKQLKDITNSVNKPLTFAADRGTTNKKLGDTMTIKGDGTNINTTIGTDGTLVASITDRPTFGDVAINTEGKGTINNLTNRTWNVQNYVNGQAATEDQLKAVDDRITQLSGGVKTVSAGKNISITASQKDVVVSVVENPEFTTVKAGEIKVNDAGRITGLKDGVADNDAATVGQMNRAMSSVGSNWTAVSNRLHGMDRRISSVGAMAAAFSAMMPLDYDEENPTMFSVGFGHYSGQNSIAVGVQHYANRDLLFNGGVAWSSDEKMFRLGATWRMGRSEKYETTRVSTTELRALREVDNLKSTVSTLTDELQEQRAVNAAILARLEALEGQKSQVKK